MVVISYTTWTDVSSGSSREDFTMSLLAKFQKKLSSAKEKANEKSDEEGEQYAPTLDDKNEIDDDEDWWAFFYLEEELYQDFSSESHLLRVEAIKISSHGQWGIHAIAIRSSEFPLPRTPWGAAEPGTLLGPTHLCLTQIYNSLVL